MKIKSRLFIFMLVVGIFGIIGEVRCVMKAIACDWKSPYTAEIVYTVSACTQLGGIVGWINIKDE